MSEEEASSAEVGAQRTVFRKSATEHKPNLPELTASAVKQNVQKHWYYHWEQELKYYDTCNEWILVWKYAWKNYDNAAIIHIYPTPSLGQDMTQDQFF